MQCLVTEDPSTCLITVPGGTTAVVRGDTPNPPTTVTITAPAVFPIPVITRDTMRETPGLIASPSPPSSFFAVGFDTFPEYLAYGEPGQTIGEVPIGEVEVVDKDPRAAPSGRIVGLLVYMGVALSSVLLPREFATFYILHAPSTLFSFSLGELS